MTHFAQPRMRAASGKATAAAAVPRSSVRSKIWRDRIRGVTMLTLALIGLKVVAVMTLGANLFAAKVAMLSSTGSTIDKAIAWLIEPDALTLAVAQTLRSFGL